MKPNIEVQQYTEDTRSLIPCRPNRTATLYRTIQSEAWKSCGPSLSQNSIKTLPRMYVAAAHFGVGKRQEEEFGQTFACIMPLFPISGIEPQEAKNKPCCPNCVADTTQRGCFLCGL